MTDLVRRHVVSVNSHINHHDVAMILVESFFRVQLFFAPISVLVTLFNDVGSVFGKLRFFFRIKGTVFIVRVSIQVVVHIVIHLKIVWWLYFVFLLFFAILIRCVRLLFDCFLFRCWLFLLLQKLVIVWFWALKADLSILLLWTFVFLFRSALTLT